MLLTNNYKHKWSWLSKRWTESNYQSRSSRKRRLARSRRRLRQIISSRLTHSSSSPTARCCSQMTRRPVSTISRKETLSLRWYRKQNQHQSQRRRKRRKRRSHQLLPPSLQPQAALVQALLQLHHSQQELSRLGSPQRRRVQHPHLQPSCHQK